MIEMIAPVLGYIASVLLAIALLVNNDLKFRWINTFGNIVFIIYGILINAFPIILTNTILILINIYYLAKIYRTKENFDMVDIQPDDKLVAKFLSFYQKDIHAYFPEFTQQNMDAEIRFVVLRDLVIANIFVASISNKTAFVKINYTVPKYRDFKVGKFIFDKEKKYLLSKGVQSIAYNKVFNKKHENFLKVHGFIKETINGNECYVKPLA